MKNKQHTVTVNTDELGIILDGLGREANEARDAYRRSRSSADPLELKEILARKQMILDLAARLIGEQPAVLTATPEQIAQVRAHLEAEYHDLHGYTDAEVIALWNRQQETPDHQGAA